MTKPDPDMPTKRQREFQRRMARKLRHRAKNLRKIADELDGMAATMADPLASAFGHDKTRTDT